MNAVARLPLPESAETVHLGLGSNIGPRRVHLRRALFALAAHPEIILRNLSRIYESEFVGPGEQACYLNLCAEVETSLAPRVLLSVLQSVETRLGRRPDSHMQPRTVDLDILLFGDRIIDSPRLTIPHPRLRERAFVLRPLAEIAAGVRLPDSAETVAAACAKIPRRGGPWLRLLAEDAKLPGPEAGGEDDWFAALALHSR